MFIKIVDAKFNSLIDYHVGAVLTFLIQNKKLEFGVINGSSELEFLVNTLGKVTSYEEALKVWPEKEIRIALVGKIPIALIDKQTNEFCLINHFITKEMETKTPYGLLDYLENKYKIFKDDIINQIINVENHG